MDTTGTDDFGADEWDAGQGSGDEIAAGPPSAHRPEGGARERGDSLDSAMSEAFAEMAAQRPDAAATRDPAAAHPRARLNTELAGAHLRARPEGDGETHAAGAERPQATPDRWSPQEEAAFAALPPEAKALVEKRIGAIESDYARHVEGSAEAIRLAREIGAVVEPDLQRKLEIGGMTIGQGVKYLAEMERMATTRPAEYLALVARHARNSGVDVAGVLAPVLGAGAARPPSEPAAAQGPVDPRIGQADPRIAPLEHRIGALAEHIRQNAQRRAWTEAGEAMGRLRDAKDAGGAPLRPHFDAVTPEMTALIRANPGLSLEQAYDAAVWSNPASRARIEGESRAAGEKRARAEAALAARAVRGNVRAGTRPMANTQPVNSLDDALSQAFAEINR